MASSAMKRRNIEDEVRRPKKKIRKFKKQKEYHSSSEDEGDARGPRIPRDAMRISIATKKNKISKPTVPSREVNNETPKAPAIITEGLEDDQEQDSEEDSEEDPEEGQEIGEVEVNTALNMQPGESDDSEEEEEDLSDDDGGVQVDNLDDVESDDDDELLDEFDADEASEGGASRKKRNDPSAFATSISKILTTKLRTNKRVDPILSRSKTADEATKALADEKLDTKARASIRAEKRSLLERGRVKDVLGLNTPGVDTGAIVEDEKRLKKTAQRGVVKLFNAVRAAQVKAEEAEKAARDAGLVGMQKREERINEMSKEGFLDLISRGGKSAAVES